MKLNSTFKARLLAILTLVLLVLVVKKSSAQTTLALGSPLTYIYGLTGNGEIYEIKTSNASTYRTIKNNSYTGNSPKNANGLAYNSTNGKFYYFKRNVTESSPEFVSFDPLTNTVTILAASTCADDVHTGCISFDGKGYYTVDVQGNLNFYNILTNTWKTITSNIVDQNNNNVTAVIQSQSAGDMAMDGWGNIWLVTSSSSNYGVYKIPFPMPVNPVVKLTVTRTIAPTATTPTGNSFAGIAFNANGQIFMGTKNDNRLYLLQNASTLSFVGTFTNSDAGNDLTSLNFPMISVLPVKWLSVNATVQHENDVTVKWEVIEEKNKGFYVQHSLDGTNWKDVTFIASNGIAETEQTYAYSYTNNLNGKQYYRVKQVDIDGKETFSEVRTVTLQSDRAKIAIWPNPAKDNISIINDGAKNVLLSKAQIFDLSGKMQLEKSLQAGINNINISSLPAGAYFVRTQTNTELAYNQKIIKQ